MLETLKELTKAPYAVVLLIVGATFFVYPTVTISKDSGFSTHVPTVAYPLVLGALLIVASAVLFYLQWRQSATQQHAGLDLTKVRERDGSFSTRVGACEIRVVMGRIEQVNVGPNAAVVLPCNEYFDDRCVDDRKSALGSFVNAAFTDSVPAFCSLVQEECHRQFGEGTVQQKTSTEQARSYGAGRCLLIPRPLGRAAPVALISSTTQRAGQGLAGRVSYLFNGLQELVGKLVDARLTEAVMPILGAGHGGIDERLAFVGLLLAIREAAGHQQEGPRLRKVTVVVFRSNEGADPSVEPLVVRRALALIAT